MRGWGGVIGMPPVCADRPTRLSRPCRREPAGQRRSAPPGRVAWPEGRAKVPAGPLFGGEEEWNGGIVGMVEGGGGLETGNLKLGKAGEIVDRIHRIFQDSQDWDRIRVHWC